MVPKAGVEPARVLPLRILSPARLPIPPLRPGDLFILTQDYLFDKRFFKKNLGYNGTNDRKVTSYVYTFRERSEIMESKLIEKSIAGDVESFEKLVTQYNRYIYNIAYRMMGNEEDAKDMSQEALIKAYKGISKFKQESNFSTWLYRIVINVCKDELRKRSLNTVSMEEPIGEKNAMKDLIEDDSNQVNPVIVYEQLELKREIETALNKLTEEGKSVIILKDILGYSYQEIGEILQIPIGTVRSRLSRGRTALKTELQLKLSEQ